MKINLRFIGLVVAVVALIALMIAVRDNEAGAQELPADCQAYQEAEPDKFGCGSGEKPDDWIEADEAGMCPVEGMVAEAPFGMCFYPQESGEENVEGVEGGHQPWRLGPRGECQDWMDGYACQLWQDGYNFPDENGDCSDPDNPVKIPGNVSGLGLDTCTHINPEGESTDSGEDNDPQHSAHVSEYLGEAFVATENTRCRLTPDGEILLALPLNTQVAEWSDGDTKDGWQQVEIDGTRCFISVELLSASPVAVQAEVHDSSEAAIHVPDEATAIGHEELTTIPPDSSSIADDVDDAISHQVDETIEQPEVVSADDRNVTDLPNTGHGPQEPMLRTTALGLFVALASAAGLGFGSLFVWHKRREK